MRCRHSSARDLLVAACAAVLLAGGAGLALKGGDAASWVSAQWKDFASPTAPLPDQGSARLTSARSSRSATYRVAIDAFSAQPLRGEGAGSYEVRWMRTRTLDEKLRDAHSLPLQTLAELGLVGLAALVAFVAAVLFALWRAMRNLGVLRRSQAAAAGAAFTAWLVHASLDWDWEMPAVTGVAIVLGATLLATRRAAAGA
jgi:O-antigen ligase